MSTEIKHAPRPSVASISPTVIDAEAGQAYHHEHLRQHMQYPTDRHDPQNGHGMAKGYDGSGGHMGRYFTPGGHMADSSQPAFPVYHRKFGNPAPLGLLAFGATTFILSMYNLRARGVIEPNVVLGMALGYGGLVQLIAGIQEWACGNSFGATAFSSYGGFWLSFGTLYIPFFGVADAYGSNTTEFHNAIGIYLAAWAIVTMIFLLASFKSSIALSSLFFFLTVTFWLLCAGELSGSLNCARAGGAFGILTSAIAAYTALAGLLTKDTSHFSIPVGALSRGDS